MKRNALLIGSFVVAAGFIVLAAIFWLGGDDWFGRQQKATVFYEDNVSGLSVGAPVTFRGVAIGQVTEIGIRVDGATLRTTVPVVLKLQSAALNLSGTDAPADIPALVQRGLRARLASQSIVTGQKAVELDFAPDTDAKLHGATRHPEIPAIQDRFGPLIEQVAELPLRETVREMRATVEEMRATLVSVQQTLGGVQTAMASASGELQKTAVASRETLSAATETIRELQASSRTTLASIDRLAQSTEQTVRDARPELQAALEGAREASQSARLAMNRLADLSSPDAPLRADLEAAVRDLSQAARGLRSFSELLEEQPNALIFGNRRE
ncbi:MAG: MCE family protein [Hydrogenophaga sp.]|uniref:MlaD family protein n=1 Tax=Hydrogenophaga sp. TaxID=1904254 RepID=UPI00257A962D|nr:MlaD family protein [Hydrogenophaga sp.]MBL0944721.1 MCE family protein [Hydrogenophaga sp.]